MFEKNIEILYELYYNSSKQMFCFSLPREKEVHNMENYDYEKIVYQMLKRVQNQKIWKKIYTVLKVLLEQQED